MTMMTVKDRLKNPDVTLEEISAHLNAMPIEAQRDELFVLGRAAQRILYGLAASGEALTLDYFSTDGEVEHWGFNSLPVPSPFRRFSKVFTRGADGALFGFNEGITRKLIGPGYFIAVPTKGNAEWEARSAVVIDYFEVPAESPPEGWPAVVSNDVGLQMFVYRHTRDFMRKVSDSVTIGTAFKNGKAMDQFFILVRSR